MKRGSHLATLVAGLSIAASAGIAFEPARAEPVAREGARHRSVTEGLDCATCHTSDGWRVTDGARGGGFDHARTGFPLTGRHQGVSCTGCHRSGERITRECSGCHADPHERRLGTQCDDCHDARDFRKVSAVELHARTRLPLTGMHVLADCSECHRTTGPRQWSGVPADCFACHADDFRRGDVHPPHVGSMGTRAFSHDCAACHRAISWTPAFIAPGLFDDGVAVSAGGLRLDASRHELVFPIAHGAHRGASCEDCHGSDEVARAVRCTGCHAHNPVRLRRDHAKHPTTLAEGACLHCHRGGAAR